MKIVITAENDSLESNIDQRFGRCRYFLLVDTENRDEVEAVENEGAIQGHGAGIKAAQQVGELGAEAVITGNIGPNAADVLSRLGIKTYHASGIAKDAVDKFISEGLDEIAETVEPKSGLTEVQSDGERIFFPLLDDNGMDSRISHHFGHAPFFGLFDVNAKVFTISENVLEHADPNKSPVDQIVEAVNPTAVFAQGIGSRAIMLFKEKGITLKTGPYDTVKDAVANLDKLTEQLSDCGHGHH